VVSLNFSNHQKFCGETKEGNRNMVTHVPTGLKDEDVDDLLKFPKLKRVRFEKMLMTDKGYAVVEKIPDLEAALFMYCEGPHQLSDFEATPAFQLTVKDQTKLRVLEFKHLFNWTKASESHLHELPTFPDLRVLELDNGVAHRQNAKPFIERHKDLLSLQLHRTSITAGDLKDLAPSLQKLEGIELKGDPEKDTRTTFEALGMMKKLKVIVVNFNVPSWSGGASALSNLDDLRVLKGKGSVPSDVQSNLKKKFPNIEFGNAGDLTSKDNDYFMEKVIPWWTEGAREEYLKGQKQTQPDTQEDIG
jgi:hypothetical protein